MGKKKGYAFVLVLCISVLMSALLLGIMTISLGAVRTTRSVESTYKLSNVTQSGVEKGLLCVKQWLKITPASLNNSTDFKWDKFTFNDSGITCTVSFGDVKNYDPSGVSAIKIDSLATDNKTKKTKEITAYIKRSDISNIYYKMLFSNVITVLDTPSSTNTNTSFDIGDGINDLTVDGNMYLQGGIVNIKPQLVPDTNENDQLSNAHPNAVYYQYSDSSGVTNNTALQPNPDLYSAIYSSGTINVNCKALSISDTTGTNKDKSSDIFNTSRIKAYTIDTLSDADKTKIDDKGSSKYYPLLNMIGPLPSEGLLNYTDYTQSGYIIKFIPPQTNQNLAAFLITKDPSHPPTVPFYWGSFMDTVKDYIETNVNVIAKASSTAKKEALYKGIYKVYLIDGDADINESSSTLAYINHIIYCTGKCHIYRDYATSLLLQNCSIMAKSVIIDQFYTRGVTYHSVNIGGWWSPTYKYVITTPFNRAVSLHGIKAITDGDDVDGLNPYSQNNRDFINGFLIRHLSNYSDNFTFKIDKWVEK